MKFSVLMSVYKKDNPDYFKAALESVTVHQSQKPSQVVIVYDGPVDDLIEEYVAEVRKCVPKIEVTEVKLEKNRGLAAALNVGLKYCSYDWVARMDSDDVSEPDRFDKQIKWLEQNAIIDVLGGNIAEFENDSEVINGIRVVEESHAEIIKMMKRRNPFNHMTVMYRKEKVDLVGGYDETIGKLEDYKLWADMLLAGCRLANVQEILVRVRTGYDMLVRRSEKREIKDWDRLQKSLYNAGIVSKLDVFINGVTIRLFVNMPVFLKKLVYRYIVRKRN